MEYRTRLSPKIAGSIVFDPKKKRTKDSFKDECDINKIMKKYLRYGQLPALVQREPQYGDFSEVPDYQEALEIVHRAEVAFSALPAAVRRECENDPAVFLERVQDPEWARKHELALPKEVTPPGQPSPAPASKEGAEPPNPPAGGKD